MLHAPIVTDWTEIAERVLVRRHASYDLNAGLVIGDERCLVIDTRASSREGADLATAVREVTRMPWLVVNTHAHFDHFLGNVAFPGADIWASGRCAEVVTTEGERQRAAAALGLRNDGRRADADDLAATLVVAPTHTFRTRTRELDLGGRGAHLHYLGRGHTDNDIVVTVPDSGVTFAGDLAEEGAPPAFEDAYPLDWPATLSALLDLGHLGPVVPGHGAVVNGEFVRAQQAQLARVVDAARRAESADDWRLTGLPEEAGRIALSRALAQLAGALT